MRKKTYYLAQHRKIENNFFIFYVIDHGYEALDSNEQIIDSFYELSKEYEITYLDAIYFKANKEVQVTEFFGGYDNYVLFGAIVLFIYISIMIYI